jgi:hypothetical protein
VVAVTDAPAAEDEFEHLVRKAQDRLRRAEELAHLAEDPATEAFGALAAYLDVLAGHHPGKGAGHPRLDVLDGRLDEIHEIHLQLREAAVTAATATKAEISKNQAEVARAAASQIAASAALQLKTMTRTSWRRARRSPSVSLPSSGGVLCFAWGSGAAARTIASADAAVHLVAKEEGSAAVNDWDTLMRNNPI